MHKQLNRLIDNARQDHAYKNYLDVRTKVLNMLTLNAVHTDDPSNYWKEELAGFNYMLDASPLIIKNLREHCYHLTGLRSYEYRIHHAHQSQKFAEKLESLRALDNDNLFIPESPRLGGFGHNINGDLVNLDTLKFYECLIAQNKAGVLASFRNGSGNGKSVLEIGAGWGGFAYQFKSLCPKVTYIIIDLPQVLLFSASYLKTLFPNASVYIYDENSISTTLDNLKAFDFVFLPHFSIDTIDLKRIDLAINMVSFQEMTSNQVESYVGTLAALKCPFLYSLNRERSPHNQEISTVGSLIKKYYDISEIEVLDVQYTGFPKKTDKTATVKPGLLHSTKNLVNRGLKKGRPASTAWAPQKSPYDYRHIFGVLKNYEINKSG